MSPFRSLRWLVEMIGLNVATLAELVPYLMNLEADLERLGREPGGRPTA